MFKIFKKRSKFLITNKEVSVCYLSIDVLYKNIETILETNLYKDYVKITNFSFFKGKVNNILINTNGYYLDDIEKWFKKFNEQSDILLENYENLSKDVKEHIAITNSYKIKPIIESIISIRSAIRT